MIIYLATWAEDDQGETLTKVGNKQRLMSYYFLKDVNNKFLMEYITNGFSNIKGGRHENKKGCINNSIKDS